MSTPRSQQRRTSGPVVLGLLGLVVLVVVAVTIELAAPPTTPQAAETRVAQAPAQSGVWYCPVTAGEEESAVVTVAAAGDTPAEVTLVRYGEDGPVTDEPVTVAPGAETVVSLDAAAASSPVAVRWRGGPATASYRVDGDVDSEAPCAAGPAPTWHVAGLDTVGDTRSQLHLFNPFTVDAVARVVFGTPEGPAALVLTEQIVVPAGEAVAVDVDEVQPEVADLAARVEVQTGRLAAQAEVVFAGGGRVLLPAVESPSLLAAAGYGRADEGGRSHLSIYNPSEREAAVEVTVSEPRLDGTSLPSEITVPAGAVVRVPLEEASEAGQFGVSVRSLNDVGVVTTRTTVERGSSRERVGAAVARPPAAEWSVLGGSTQGRLAQLHLYNPGSEAVTADVVIDGAPAEWQDLVVEPNAYVRLDLAEVGERPGVPLRVLADGPVTAQLYSRTQEDEPALWTPLGVPARAWTGPSSRPVVRRDPLLTREPAALLTEADDPGTAPLPQPTAPPDATEAPSEPAATEPAGTEEAPSEPAATEPAATEPAVDTGS